MSKNIIAVGISHFPSDDKHKLIDCTSYRTHRSLGDADIIILTPGPSSHSYHYSTNSYRGKDCLSDDASGHLADDRKFWSKEISKAIESGKTIFILSEAPDEFYYGTGEHQYSGTGRNRQTTRIVNLYNSYSVLPISASKIHAASGSEIAYRSSNVVLRTLWEENRDYFHYQVSYDADVFKTGAFFQKKGKDVLGGIIPTAAGGNIVVLPALDLEHPDFTETKKDPKTGEDKDYWSKKAIAFTNKFVKSLVEIDKVFSSQSVLTPPPYWSQAVEFEIDAVTAIENEIAIVEKKIEELQASKVKFQGDKDLALQPKRLLFETGKPLENAIRSALRIMGFSAEPFQDSESEFDVIFRSGEGNFLGEVEGKDNKAIDVTKISQLIRNQTEYISKDDVDTPAKGVLFGNGFRLQAPKDRSSEFTEKCIKVSTQSNIALVKTSDLFPIVKYLGSNEDEMFKQLCREAILNSKGGIVVFPPVPGAGTNE